MRNLLKLSVWRQKEIDYYKWVCEVSNSRDSSVGVATGYELEGWGSILGRGKVFSLTHSVQTGSEAYQVLYPMGTGDFSPGRIKRSGREADH
jgi:hypothetical protein